MGGFVAAVSVQQFIATGAIHLHGTPEQKRRWLAPSIAGTKVGAIAISEPDAGSDVAAIRTTARQRRRFLGHRRREDLDHERRRGGLRRRRLPDGQGRRARAGSA